MVSKEHPKDAELIEKFRVHRDDLELLVRMLKEDRSLGRVGEDFTRVSNFFGDCVRDGPDCSTSTDIGVSDARLSEYRRLFSKIGLSRGIEGYGKKELITFIVSTKGLAVTGSSKGFVYATDLKASSMNVVEDLDSYWSDDKRSFTALRHIEGSWYLYFNYED